MFRLGVIDQNSSHQLRGHAEKLRAVSPIDSCLVDQPQPGFVNQSGGLQRVSRVFPAKVIVGYSPQLLINNGKELIERRPVAGAPGDQPLGYLIWGRRIHKSGTRYGTQYRRIAINFSACQFLLLTVALFNGERLFLKPLAPGAYFSGQTGVTIIMKVLKMN